MRCDVDFVVMYDKVYPDKILYGQTLGAKDYEEAEKIVAQLKGGPNEDIRIYDMR